MTEARVLVKFSDDPVFRGVYIESIAALHKTIYPDGERISKDAVNDTVDEGIYMTRVQYDTLKALFYSFLRPTTGKVKAPYICNPPSFRTL